MDKSILTILLAQKIIRQTPKEKEKKNYGVLVWVFR